MKLVASSFRAYLALPSITSCLSLEGNYPFLNMSSWSATSHFFQSLESSSASSRLRDAAQPRGSPSSRRQENTTNTPRFGSLVVAHLFLLQSCALHKFTLRCPPRPSSGPAPPPSPRTPPPHTRFVRPHMEPMNESCTQASPRSLTRDFQQMVNKPNLTITPASPVAKTSAPRSSGRRCQNPRCETSPQSEGYRLKFCPKCNTAL